MKTTTGCCRVGRVELFMLRLVGCPHRRQSWTESKLGTESYKFFSRAGQERIISNQPEMIYDSTQLERNLMEF
ncbi:hypothetical protein OIU78_019072 [Salix suchowensis]|nr:hypothetical protein OIU78_019072 [Salix suchowensis]